MNRMYLAAGLLLMSSPWTAQAVVIDPRFALDPASPSIQGNLTPDDVLRPGPVVSQPGTSLGLVDQFSSGVFDNLNALSYGRDPIHNPLYFSVDRVAVGAQGTAVNAQAAPGVEEAAGDIYKTLPPVNNNQLFIDEQQLGLIPGFFGDDLDALDLDQTPSPWTYYSFDFLSASNGFGTFNLANNIYASLGLGDRQIYFDLESLGFDPHDDLDALVLSDAANNGVVNPGVDQMLFSLSAFSPSTFTGSGSNYLAGQLGHLSPSDVLWTDFNTWKLWASAESIGLRADDNLDALDTIPEPATVYLIGIGLLGAMLNQSRRRKEPLVKGSES